jgi:hypothetical protein
MGRRALLASAIMFATLVAAWILRYEGTKQAGVHRNRITNVRCHAEDECWFKSDQRVQ